MKHKAQAVFEYLASWFQDTRRDPFIPTKHLSFFNDLFNEVFNNIVVTARMSQKEPSLIEYFDVQYFQGTKLLMHHSLNEHGGMMVAEEFDSQDIKYPQKRFIDALLGQIGLLQQFNTPITLKEMESIPQNSNPFHFDAVRMGTALSGSWYVMYTEHFASEKEPETLVLVNSKTGRRFELDLTEVNQPLTV